MTLQESDLTLLSELRPLVRIENAWRGYMLFRPDGSKDTIWLSRFETRFEGIKGRETRLGDSTLAPGFGKFSRKVRQLFGKPSEMLKCDALSSCPIYVGV
jgi:hypothetical protein